MSQDHDSFCNQIDPIISIIDKLKPDNALVPNSQQLILRFKELYIQNKNFDSQEANDIWNKLIHLSNGEKVLRELWFSPYYPHSIKTSTNIPSSNVNDFPGSGSFSNDDHEDHNLDDEIFNL